MVLFRPAFMTGFMWRSTASMNAAVDAFLCRLDFTKSRIMTMKSWSPVF